MNSILALVLTASSVAGSTFTIDSLLDIKHPSRAAWSPDGTRIAFLWDRAGLQNVYVVPAEGGAPEALTFFEQGLIDGLFWNPDGRALFFAKDGDLWQVGLGKEAPRAVFKTPEVESEIVLSPDGASVAFVRGGDLWVRSIAEGKETRLTETPVNESGPAWSPDGTRIAFSFSTANRQSDGFDYVGGKLAFIRFERTLPDVGVVPAAGGRVTTLGASPGAEGAPRWIDNTRLSLQRVATDYKSREVLVADATTGQATAIHRDVDEKWWSIDFLGPEPLPSPDGKWIAFLSDRDGWDHVYVVPTSGGAVHQVTRGAQEISRIAWSPDGKRIAFDTNEGGHPGWRHLAVADLGADPSKATILKLTAGRGTNVQSAERSGFLLERALGGWSPDGRRLLYVHTDPKHSADLFWIDAGAPAGTPHRPHRPHRLTDSMPESIDREAFVEPELVHYTAPDGEQVPAYLFVPTGLDRARKHPAIVWIHGDGIAQNYDGWHPRRDYAVYYSFHQYLVASGYVVLAPDYRGSIGYGKKFRQAVYLDVGGKDFEDVPAGVPYLESLGFVDKDRIGVWGLSYGGFFTLQALTLTPELFRCGIDVAGVQDYRYWHRDPGGRWIVGRMGSPEQNPDAYRRAAPIERADKIVRPLLVLHGTADTNVPFLESVRLVDELVKRGKDVEFMMYPGEFHYFQRAHVVRDAWQRVERFFATHLKEAKAAPPSP